MNHATPDDLRAFERQVADLWENGELPYPIHLSGGLEDCLVDLFYMRVRKGDWFFSTHRQRHHALLAGVSPKKIISGVKSGHPLYLFDKKHNFYSSPILAGVACIAVGVAWTLKHEQSKNRVWCFIGDGAEEEGHFAEAVTMTMAHNLPVKFIIEDNERSSAATTQERNPSGFRIAWPSECVERIVYKPTYPHAGTGVPMKAPLQDRKPT